MSEQNVRAFFEKVGDDKSLQDRIWSLRDKAQKNPDGAVEELVKIASSAGFRFTPEHYAVVRAAHVAVDPPISPEDHGKSLECCNSGWSCCNTKSL
ncbi:MAG: Nif11-like leader peptide family natural product precursor [Methylovirgula sp.]